jgi:nicotinamidase-related amidase
MVDFAIVPGRTALVNVDMQNCFVEGLLFQRPTGWTY